MNSTGSWLAGSKKGSPPNQLYCGDCLPIIKDRLDKDSVDLIYLDPPFNSNVDYKTFTDKWCWQDKDQAAYDHLVGNDTVGQTIKGLGTMLGKTGMLSYLLFLAERLLIMREVLKPTGSLYLHCDPTASHYIKIILDGVFGKNNFNNEIIWHYTGGGRARSYFSKKHDAIFWYSKTGKHIFNIDAMRVPYKETSGYAKEGIVAKSGKHYRPHPKGTPVDDVWDMPIINPLAKERLGYPTQKPLILLERIIEASSHKGDLLLDPFCGGGTAIDAAQKLNRRWIGIDIAPRAIELTCDRLIKNYGEEIKDQLLIDGL